MCTKAQRWHPQAYERSRQTEGQAGKKAGRQAGGQAGGQAGRQVSIAQWLAGMAVPVGRQAGRQSRLSRQSSSDCKQAGKQCGGGHRQGLGTHRLAGMAGRQADRSVLLDTITWSVRGGCYSNIGEVPLLLNPMICMYLYKT